MSTFERFVPPFDLRRATVDDRRLDRGTLFWEGTVKTPRLGNDNRIVHAAAWFYVMPRAVITGLVLATVGLATFLALIQLAIVILHRLGA
ncbi:MAG: hypothetical protein ACRD9W_21030 [Terriglobia bacterium]